MAAARRKHANKELLAESGCESRFAPVPTADGDGRKFPRFYFRTLATATIHPVPVIGTETLECYVLTRDLSRGGICFMHPAPLSPSQRIDFEMSDGRKFTLAIRAIRREEDGRYFIGCRLADIVDPNQ